MTTTPAKPAKPAASGTAYDAGQGLAAHLSGGLLHALYLVTAAEMGQLGRDEDPPGADPALLRAASLQIETAAMRDGDPALDRVVIDYLDGDRDGDGVHALAARETRNVSLFGGRRVVTILHADALAFAGADADEAPTGRKKKATGSDPLEAVIAALDPELGRPPFVLIVVAERIDRRRKAWKLLLQHGALVEVPLMTVTTLQQYLNDEGKPFGIQADRQVAQRIWDRLGGGDPSRLRQTADRLLLDAGPKGTVTVAMVEASVPMDRDAGVFAITDAISQGDATRAITVLHLLLEHASATESERTGEVMKTFGILNSHYAALLKIHAGLAKQPGASADQLGQTTGVHPFRIKNMLPQLRSMRPGRLEQAIASLDAADTLLKSSAIGDRKLSTSRWLERLLLSLASGQPLRAPSRPHIFDTLT